MINSQKIALNVEVITQEENTDKIEVLVNKSKNELLFSLDKLEDEIEDKYIPVIESLIEDMSIYKLNRLEKAGILVEKFDVITTEYTQSTDYPSDLQNRINNIVNKINPNSSSANSGYAIISSPFLD